ncbi:MAG: hypothetical protein ABL895_14250 [Cyclobacteriaceae bacterium]
MATNDKVCLLLILLLSPAISYSQQKDARDTVIYNVTYRDTVIYRYETVLIKQFVYSDTIRSTSVASNKKKGLNSNNWGIGPSVAAYYSPYHGFDVAVGFGVQYYMFAVPSFRTPHTGRKKSGK